MIDVISGIKIPDSKIAREAAELVRQHETEMLFNHSVRVFIFGAMEGIRQISKYLAGHLVYHLIMSVRCLAGSHLQFELRFFLAGVGPWGLLRAASKRTDNACCLASIGAIAPIPTADDSPPAAAVH
jgi:hypothetical protein